MDKSCTKMYINKYGDKAYKNSKGYCHREDGPAIEYSDISKSWYILYKKLEEKDFNSWINRIKKCI